MGKKSIQMTLTPDQKEKVIQKVMAIDGRIGRAGNMLDKCERLRCPIAKNLGHELDMIRKATSGIIEEVNATD